MTPPLSDLHMLALKWILDHDVALPADVAAGLGLPELLAQQLCQELEVAGYIAPAPKH